MSQQTPAVLPETRDGIDGWLNTETGRWLPRLAGADDAPPAETPAAETPPAETPPAETPPAETPPPADEPLGAAGLAALQRERAARQAAEARAKAAETKVKEREQADLTAEQRAQAEATEAREQAQAATEQLREAKLLVSLGDHGLTGAKAKAAVRLLDGVEYDDTSHEPTNLQDALDAAKATYGDDLFTGATPAKPKPPRTNGGEGADEDREGPALTAEELQFAESFGMTPEEYAAHKSPQQPTTTT